MQPPPNKAPDRTKRPADNKQKQRGVFPNLTCSTGGHQLPADRLARAPADHSGLEAETMGQCSGPKTRRSSLFFTFFFSSIWQRLEVSRSSTAADTEAFCARVCTPRWGLSEIPPPPSPRLSSHDSMRALCVSLRAVLFLSIHVAHRRERPGRSGGCRPVFAHLARQQAPHNSRLP